MKTCLADSGQTAFKNLDCFHPTVENVDRNRPRLESIVASAGLWRAAATVDCSFIIAPQERIAIENTFSNIKKFGLFHRVNSRGASHEDNELTYFILVACVLHNCEIQFHFTK